MCKDYKPSWFYCTELTGFLASGLIQATSSAEVKFEKSDHTPQADLPTYKVKTNNKTSVRNKALIIVPGVGCDSESLLVQSMSKAAL